MIRAYSGDSVAQYKLAVIYRDGYSYAKMDNDSALNWFLKSAEKGHPEALYAVGKIYKSEPDGLKPSEKDMEEAWSKAYEKAKPWFEQAAAKNHRDAKRSLWMYYLHKRDVVSLYAWQGLALSQSTPESRRKRFESDNRHWKFKITEAQIREAEKFINEWKPQSAPPPIDMSDLKPSKLNRLLKPACRSLHCIPEPQ